MRVNKLPLLFLLTGSCLGAGTNTNFLYSVTNLATKLRYDFSTQQFTNKIDLKFSDESRVFSLLSSNNTLYVWDSTPAEGVLKIQTVSSNITVLPGTNVNIIQPANLGASYAQWDLWATNIHMRGVIGMTTNLLQSAPNSKTNQLQFSGGILTNVVMSY